MERGALQGMSKLEREGRLRIQGRQAGGTRNKQSVRTGMAASAGHIFEWQAGVEDPGPDGLVLAGRVGVAGVRR